ESEERRRTSEDGRACDAGTNGFGRTPGESPVDGTGWQSPGNPASGTAEKDRRFTTLRLPEPPDDRSHRADERRPGHRAHHPGRGAVLEARDLGAAPAFQGRDPRIDDLLGSAEA